MKKCFLLFGFLSACNLSDSAPVSGDLGNPKSDFPSKDLVEDQRSDATKDVGLTDTGQQDLANSLCGNDTIDGDEGCDGDQLAQQTCTSVGFNSGTIKCSNCELDLSGCFTCGDGIVQSSEVCEEDNFEGRTCAGELGDSLVGYASGTLYCDDRCTQIVTNRCQRKFKEVEVGSQHTCALLENGEVQCWGRNDLGQTSVPSDRFKTIVLGGNTSCGITQASKLKCWGENVPVPLNENIVQLAVGINHACAVQLDGKIQCWGIGTDGQTSPPRTGNFMWVGVGNSHTCGLTRQGQAVCWGKNDNLQSSPPTTRFTQIVGMYNRTCGLSDLGRIECWGENIVNIPNGNYERIIGSNSFFSTRVCGVESDGQFLCSDSPSVNNYDPLHLETIKDVAVATHSCVVFETGRLKCVGQNRWAQVILPGEFFNSIFHEIGEDRFCALDPNGKAKCWGRFQGPPGEFSKLSVGDDFVLGLTTEGGLVFEGTPPVSPPTDLGFVDVSVARREICVITKNNKIQCEGSFNVIEPSGEFVKLQTARRGGCAIRKGDGSIQCWGQTVAAPVGNGFVDIRGNKKNFCAIKADGILSCWGENQWIAPTGNFSKFALSKNFNVALCTLRKGSNEIECWRRNGVKIQSLDLPSAAFSEISMGRNVGCAIGATKRVSCWALTL